MLRNSYIFLFFTLFLVNTFTFSQSADLAEEWSTKALNTLYEQNKITISEKRDTTLKVSLNEALRNYQSDSVFNKLVLNKLAEVLHDQNKAILLVSSLKKPVKKEYRGVEYAPAITPKIYCTNPEKSKLYYQAVQYFNCRMSLLLQY